MPVVDRLFDLLRERLTANAPVRLRNEEYAAGVTDGVAAARRLCSQLIEGAAGRSSAPDGPTHPQLVAFYVQLELATLTNVITGALETPLHSVENTDLATSDTLGEVRAVLERARRMLAAAAPLETWLASPDLGLPRTSQTREGRGDEPGGAASQRG